MKNSCKHLYISEQLINLLKKRDTVPTACNT